jgi:hypothetical protein
VARQIEGDYLERKDKIKGHPSPARLGSLRGVRKEMARLYQLAASGEIEAGKATRLVYILREIRCALESEALNRLEERLAELQRIAKLSAPGQRAIEMGSNDDTTDRKPALARY